MASINRDIGCCSKVYQDSMVLWSTYNLMANKPQNWITDWWSAWFSTKGSSRLDLVGIIYTKVIYHKSIQKQKKDARFLRKVLLHHWPNSPKCFWFFSKRIHWQPSGICKVREFSQYRFNQYELLTNIECPRLWYNCETYCSFQSSSLGSTFTSMLQSYSHAISKARLGHSSAMGWRTCNPQTKPAWGWSWCGMTGLVRAWILSLLLEVLFGDSPSGHE